MKQLGNFRTWLAALLIFSIAACTSEDIDPQAPASPDAVSVEHVAFASGAVTLSETFSGGFKSSYSNGSVNFNTGSWYLQDALTGTSSSDRKFNSRSVRIRSYGRLRMNFDKLDGAGTVTLYHAKFGRDGNSSWELWFSTNGGSSWSRAGSRITTSSTSLRAVTFTINRSGRIRFEVRKTSGSVRRINIDNVSITSYGSSGGGSAATKDNNLAMGNPSAAVTSTSFSTNYLLQREEYSLSYNRTKGTPNWVSWHLSSAWQGSARRRDNFRTDGALPSGWYRVSSSSYTNSGFDRGHVCPSADRTLSQNDNDNTFFMTNIIPQSPDNNQRTWKYFEDYCRDLMDEGNELYVIAGGYGQGGTGRNGTRSTIDNGRVTVPSHTWKVVVVLPNGSNDVNRVNTSTRVIAVFMPNNRTVDNQNWTAYRTSVNYIESLTGYNLLSNVSGSVQNVIEARVDNQF